MQRSSRLAVPFRIQAFVGGDLEYFREVLLGVRQHGFATGRLEVTDRWLPHELRGDLRARVRRERIDGIVAGLHTPAMERRFAELGVPVVNISNAVASPRLPLVTQDDEAVGRLAAAHLRACGCRAFGFWGHGKAPYSEQRRAGFRAALAGESLAESASELSLEREELRMRRWLEALPKPAGVFAVLDTLALGLMRAARASGLRVPEDVAMLGAGDDDFWVEFESVPLSSVRLPARRIGQEAAALLDRLIAGHVRGGGAAPVLRLPVLEVAARRSTDVLFIEDQAVARAVRHIREHAHENPYVNDIAKAAGVSRTALSRRFQATLGRTLLAEIRRERVRRAQGLLRETDLKLTLVAERCGFPNSQRFSVLFRQLTGTTPSECRREARAGNEPADAPARPSRPR